MNKKISVYGMHCKACELLIENKISEISGVKLKRISQKENYVEIDAESEKEIEKVKIAIENLGYKSEKNELKKNNIGDYITILIIFIIFGIIYFLLKDINLFKDLLKTQNLNFFIIILIGIAASLSSCLAVTGGIILGFSNYIDTGTSNFSHIKTQINFHIGRIFGFAFLGGILGSIGGYLGSFGMLNKFLLLLAGLFMFYMGLNMLGFLPSITKLGFSMPKFLGNKILNIKNPIFAPIVGVLTFFLPCGFTQSMQVYAASSSSFLNGSMIMGAFALGTMPILFLVGFGSSYFKGKNFDYINKIIGVIVIYFGIFILSGFTNFININSFINSNSSNSTTITTNNINLQDFKEITVTHDGDFLVPDEIILEGAKKYKLIINPESDGLGCKYALTIPGIDENEYQIRKGVPIIININNPIPGTYRVICTAMGMRHGTILIK